MKKIFVLLVYLIAMAGPISAGPILNNFKEKQLRSLINFGKKNLKNVGAPSMLVCVSN
jgi:hypothetical protein